MGVSPLSYAAFNSQTSAYATAFSIHDLSGKIWAIGYRKIPLGTVMAAELQAIQDDYKFWRIHEPGPIRILSDSIDAIHFIHID